jgi:hypothetical protein
MNSWILIGFTSVMTGFVLFVRFTDLLKHQKLRREFFDQNADVEKLIHNNKTLIIYALSALAAGSFAFFVEGNLIERIVLSVLFFLLVISEGMNAYIHSTLYSSSKAFLYGVVTERYRSIKTFKPKGKRKSILFTLRNQEHTLPNDVALALQAQQKQAKLSKKS